ncbi:hypothetical protein [Xanthomonas campestris]|uniref:hypothetical protein n=1 Tax=Xanthomonas campestris TaxID=339 RepID=UPI0005AEEFE7|nr:hypothetical protein [Xanthomonas campestris]KIQ25542.1 hypothetical protein RT95_14190 [Xanthomonas campestris]
MTFDALSNRLTDLFIALTTSGPQQRGMHDPHRLIDCRQSLHASVSTATALSRSDFGLADYCQVLLWVAAAVLHATVKDFAHGVDGVKDGLTERGQGLRLQALRFAHGDDVAVSDEGA